MKIIVDTRMVHHGGIGTYLRALLPFLNVEPFSSNVPIYSLREQLAFTQKIPPCDLFCSPNFKAPLLPIQAKKRVVTIHDLYHLDRYLTLSLSKRLYIKTVLHRVMTKADQLITVSEFSKSRILHHFPEVEKKLTVIHSGCDHLARIKPIPVPRTKPFFLCVGNDKAHKNRSIVLEAMKAFPEMELVTVGAKVHVSEGELVWLYKHARALIFPSLYEGWGLPPLEAMQLGCPVIASTAASIPEACGQAALYFDPLNYHQLAERLQELPNRRSQMIEEGYRQAAKFTWETAAKKHAHVFDYAHHKMSPVSQ